MQLTKQSYLELSEVERDADQLPVAWRLFRLGDNFLTIDGVPSNLMLSEADLDAIVDYHRSKGVQIPIDSRHVISNLATKVNLDESEILKRLPRLAGTGGFGSLEKRADGLWITDVKFNPLAAEVLKNGMIKYFSPAIRGLDGKSPLRVTSVALDNEPKISNVSSLAASEEGGADINVLNDAISQLTKEVTTMDPANDPNKVAGNPAANNPPAGDADVMAILKEVLGADVSPETLKGALAALKAKADKTDSLEQRIANLEMSEAASKRQVIVQRLLDSGRLAQSDVDKPFWKNMTALQLSAYEESTPANVRVPVSALELSEKNNQEQKPVAPQSFNSVREAVAGAKITDMKG